MRTRYRMALAALLAVAVIVAAGYATGVGRTSSNHSYQDARQVMTRAGFTVTNTEPRLAASWPAVIRDHCTSMLLGFYGHTGADTVQTWVCKSPADASALKARLAAQPGKVTVAPQHTTGAARYSTRENLIFFVVADSHTAAERLTQALQRS